MNSDLFLQRFGHLAQGEGGIKKLRDVILQLAVRGNLVARDTTGKWTEETLGKISKLITKGATPTTYGFSYQTFGIPFIKVENVKKGTILQNSLNCFISEEAHEFLKRSQLHEHDVLFSIAGTIGETCIIRKEDVPANTNQAFALIRGFQSHLTPEFLKLLLDSFVSKQVKNKARGGAMNNVSLGDISNLKVPLPPLAEQKRIVGKVDELMALCDKLEAEQKAQRTLKTQAVQSTLHHLTNAESPASFGTSLNILERTFGNWFDDLATVKHLRATILQLAVQGKLVPQNPTDEPASELLKRIETEKKRLVKEGKIGREKTPAPMSQDDQPYSLPEKWEWVRLGAISASIQYGYTASADSTKQEPKFVRITDIHNSRVNWETVPGCDIKPDKLPTYQLAENDFLIARTGGTIGKSFLVTNVDFESVFASYLIRIRTFPSFVLPQFLKCYLDSPLYWEQLYAASMGTGQPNVNGTSLGMLKTPLPPLAEQKRIVAKVDELMTLCDQLEAHITHTQTLNTHLMDSLIHRMTEAA